MTGSRTAEGSTCAPGGSGGLVLVALLLLAQVGLFVWMSPRGFDISDESFYFQHYLHWRELTATATFFGAVFDGPFRWMGQSIAGIRLLGLLLLLGGSGYLAFEAVRRVAGAEDGKVRPVPAVFVLTGMAGAMLYYGYLTTLRAPSYNLLALVSGLLATGLLLRLTGQPAAPRVRSALGVAYGLLMALCALGKPPSAALLALTHIAYVLTLGGFWLQRQFGPLLAWAILGASLPFLALQLAHPNWLTVVHESLLMGATTDGRSLVKLARGLVWELQALPLAFWGFAAVATGLALALGRQSKPAGTFQGPFAVALVLICMAWVITDWLTALWLPMMALATLLLFGLAHHGRRGWPLLLMLLAVPPVLSFGTNMPMLGHSQINAAFAWGSLLAALYALHAAGRLGTTALAACMAALCVPGLVFQMQAALDARHTYRQHSALGTQHVPVALGAAPSRLLVAPDMAASLQAISNAATAAGWRPGQSLLDFTGDGPGWAFALGARPLGVPWLLGGYRGSEAAASLLLGRLPEEALRRTWLLSSVNTARRIESWPQPLSVRLGPDSHELVATVNIRAPYDWAKRQTAERVDLQLWRPRVAP